MFKITQNQKPSSEYDYATYHIQLMEGAQQRGQSGKFEATTIGRGQHEHRVFGARLDRAGDSFASGSMVNANVIEIVKIAERRVHNANVERGGHLEDGHLEMGNGVEGNCVNYVILVCHHFIYLFVESLVVQSPVVEMGAQFVVHVFFDDDNGVPRSVRG